MSRPADPTNAPTAARIALLSAAAFIAGCAGPELIVEPSPAGGIPKLYDPKPVAVETGIASYYWQPQPTASGERFNPEDMTAAHKRLPFDTRVRVINLRNEKSVIVRINDRGPYIRGRIIDLSRAAAREVDMTKAGIVPVRVEILKPIAVVEKPNLAVTEKIKAKTRARVEAEAEAEAEAEPSRASRPSPTSPPDPRQHLRRMRH